MARAPLELVTHDVVLRDHELRLRPLSETDWQLLLAWNNDAELLYFAEGDRVSQRSMARVRELYCWASRCGLTFMIEREGVAIGECWLQHTEAPRLRERFGRADLRRIDLMIGDKVWWSRGIGTRVIRLLSAHAFEGEGADVVLACDVADYNLRSLGAFRRAGFVDLASRPAKPGAKARRLHDLFLARP